MVSVLSHETSNLFLFMAFRRYRVRLSLYSSFLYSDFVFHRLFDSSLLHLPLQYRLAFLAYSLLLLLTLLITALHSPFQIISAIFTPFHYIYVPFLSSFSNHLVHTICSVIDTESISSLAISTSTKKLKKCSLDE
ncbi:hypothetical protein C8J56DRAFT_112806 [Mycena floridula]|nr:hypothetical protein C8J56DRAFT_112806 [Mycena floridula]